jgi:hypothetical protein
MKNPDGVADVTPTTTVVPGTNDGLERDSTMELARLPLDHDRHV